jgi:hypothetical protein
MALAVVTVACSSSSSGGGDFATQFCSKVSSCGGAIAMCQADFSAVVVSPSCQDMLANVSCADLSAATPPAWWTSCFAPCSASSQPTCNGDGTVTTCSEGSTLVLECTGVCSALSLTYTGTCGTSYNGQTSATAKCWCH